MIKNNIYGKHTKRCYQISVTETIPTNIQPLLSLPAQHWYQTTASRNDEDWWSWCSWWAESENSEKEKMCQRRPSASLTSLTSLKLFVPPAAHGEENVGLQDREKSQGREKFWNTLSLPMLEGYFNPLCRISLFSSTSSESCGEHQGPSDKTNITAQFGLCPASLVF